MATLTKFPGYRRPLAVACRACSTLLTMHSGELPSSVGELARARCTHCDWILRRDRAIACTAFALLALALGLVSWLR